MRAAQILATCGLTLTLASAASAQEIDWKKVDAALGKTATVSGDVHRYGFPRSDLQVTVDGSAIKPALALGGWAAFMRRRQSQPQATAVQAVFAAGANPGIVQRSVTLPLKLE